MQLCASEPHGRSLLITISVRSRKSRSKTTYYWQTATHTHAPSIVLAGRPASGWPRFVVFYFLHQKQFSRRRRRDEDEMLLPFFVFRAVVCFGGVWHCVCVCASSATLSGSKTVKFDVAKFSPRRALRKPRRKGTVEPCKQNKRHSR